MDLSLDPKRYPQAATYLATLPEGHIEAQLNNEVFDTMRLRFPDLGEAPGLPAPVQELFAGKLGAWVPETLGNILYLVCRDVALDSDQAFFDFGYDATRELFQKPLYPVLVHVLSPTLLAMGAQERWGAFHRGSTLAAGKAAKEDGRTVLRTTLSYPAKLFPRQMVEFNAHVFRAAVDAANAQGSEARVAEHAAEEAVTEVSWNA